MTRSDIQTESMCIELLLDAALGMFSTESPGDAIELIEMAQARARKINEACDMVNQRKAAA